MKGLRVSPITNTIYYGTINEEKQMFTGKKEDMTNECLRAVFEWFMGNMDGHEEYSINYHNGYELVMRRTE